MKTDRDAVVKAYKRKWPLILVKRILEFFTNPRMIIRYYSDIYHLKRSKLFDEEYYLNNNDDLYLSTPNLVRHFILHGYLEERDPSPYFNITYYYQTYPDVKLTGLNPVIHYYKIGKSEGRRCLPPLEGKEKESLDKLNEIIRLDLLQNRENYSSILSEDYNKIIKSNLFDRDYYLEQYPTVRINQLDPITHYCVFGWKIGCQISRVFDFNAYRSIYTNVTLSHMNPLLHYLKIGKDEGYKLIKKSVNNDGFNDFFGDRRTRNIIEYRQKRQLRGKSSVALYTFNISDDDWLINDLNPDWDYICFIDHKDRINLDSIWEYRFIDYFPDGQVMKALYYKCHPHVYLPQYDYTIWVEPNTIYSRSISPLIQNMIDSKSEIAVFSCDVIGNKSETARCLRDEFINIDCDSRILLRNNKLRWLHESNIENWNSVFYHENIPNDFIFTLEKDHRFDSLSGVSEVLISTDYVKQNSSISGLLSTQNEEISEVFCLPSIAIIVPIFNALEDVKECLRSLKNNTSVSYELVLADDGSDSETKKWLSEYSKGKANIHFINNEDNQGYTRNVNLGVKAVKADFYIVLNSDTILSNGWLRKIVKCAYSNERIGIVGPLSNAASWQSVPSIGSMNELPSNISLEIINDSLEKEHFSIYPKSDIINGFCYCVKSEVFKSIGFFNEELFPQGYGEEDDFTLRARQHGYQCAIATDTYVFHAKSRSFGNERRLKLATESRTKLDDKYGKDSLLRVTSIIEKNPIMNFSREVVGKLFDSVKPIESVIGEPLRFLNGRASCNVETNIRIAIHLHFYYEQMLPVFISHLNRMPFKFDLLISLSDESVRSRISETLSDLKNVEKIDFRVVPNRGRDLAPMIIEWGKQLSEYDYVLHCHTKKSQHDWKMGKKWLDFMLDSLLNSPENIEEIISLFNSDNRLGFVAPPAPEFLYSHYSWGRNKEKALELLDKIGMDHSIMNNELYFPTGSFFWFRPIALSRLFNSGITYEQFDIEPIDVDGTMAHALERLIFLLGKERGYSFLTVKVFSNQQKKISIVDNYISVRKVYESIVDAIKKKKPYALIRYYDGEGAFYSLQSREKSYIDLRMNYYFGDFSYNSDDVRVIAEGITESVTNADIAGTVPPSLLFQLQKFVNYEVGGDADRLPFLKKRFDDAIDCDGVWRILSANALVLENANKSTLFCSKDIHYKLVYTGYIYQILDMLNCVSVITSQPIKSALEKLFDLEVEEYLIPPRAFDIESVRDTKHYPDVFNSHLEKLSSMDLTSSVFLVGAGPLGKIYCSLIKKQGGIALDLGAVMDSWVNFHSRPEHRRSTNSFDIDERLILNKENIMSVTDIIVKKDVSYDRRINNELKKKYSASNHAQMND